MSTFAERFNKNCEMDYLPKYPAILVSSVNMLLRDEEYDTLETFWCSNEPEIKLSFFSRLYVL